MDLHTTTVRLIADNASVCRVLGRHCRIERVVSEREGEPVVVATSKRGRELHPTNGRRVPTAEGATHLPHQQLRHDARSHRREC